MMESFEYEELSESGAEKRSLLRRFFSCRSRKGTSWMSACVLILNAVLAPGIMSLPDAFSRSGGIGVGVGMQLLLLVFIVGSLYILVCCANVNRQDTYPDVVRVICGPTVEVVSALCVTFYCYAFCVCSLVLVGDQWEKIFSDAYGGDLQWYMTRYFLLPVTSSICILPLCFIAKIEFLTNFSMMGNMMVFYCVVLVVCKYFTKDVHQGTMEYRPTEWRDFLSVIPIWCSNYQCHVEVVPIVSSLRDKSFRLFSGSTSVLVAIAVCATFYTLIATFGYLTFGQEVSPDILLQYTSGPSVLAASIAVGIKMYMTYPTLHFCGRRAIENLWVRGRGLTSTEAEEGEPWRRIVITLVTFGVVLIASLVVPNLIVIIPILGSVSAVLMFIIPGCCLAQLCRGAYLTGHKYVSLFAVAAGLMTFLGIFILCFTWTDFVIELMTNKDFLQNGEAILGRMWNNTLSTTTPTPTTTPHV